MAAWTAEVPVGGKISRTLLDMPVVLFRGSDGRAVALLDRCAHRFAPLSRGRVEGNNLICGYHGLGYAANGVCAVNPHGPVLSSIAVRSFQVHEAYRAIWIWMGDPSSTKVDLTLLPDLSFLSNAPDSAFRGDYLWGRGNYQLFVDNIMDLTHADFLHPDSLGGGHFTRTRAKVIDHDSRISAQWHCMDEKPSPLISARFKSGDRVNMWTEVDWYPPTIMTLRSGASLAQTERVPGQDNLNVHIMTPETEFTTHYFYGLSREFNVDDAAFTDRNAKAIKLVFETEDKPMIGAQQDRMGTSDFSSLKPNLLRTDEAAVRVRRKLATLIDVEEKSQEIGAPTP